MNHREQYEHFVRERHRIWCQRYLGMPQPWTADPVLQHRKFTNVFRVLDPGSQFVLTDLYADDADPLDHAMRAFLYRFTNKPAVWRDYRDKAGRYPRCGDLESFAAFLSEYRKTGTVFSGAYNISPMALGRGSNKVQAVMAATTNALRDGVLDTLVRAETTEERFNALLTVRGVASFMAMQITTDWGYHQTVTGDPENEFVAEGPGSRRGARLVGGGGRPVGVFHEWRDRWAADGPSIAGGRTLSLMDVQNTFCEYSKYARYVAAGKVGGPYRPAHPTAYSEYVVPASWGTGA